MKCHFSSWRLAKICLQISTINENLGHRQPHEILVSLYIYANFLGEQFGISYQNEKFMNYLNPAKKILGLKKKYLHVH